MQCAFFKELDWDSVGSGSAAPRWQPPPAPRRDASNFDAEYTDLDVALTPEEVVEGDLFGDFSFVNPYFS